MPAPEPPPLYDAELHAQMQADIARLCGPTRPSIQETNNPQEPRRRRIESIPNTERIARKCDAAYLMQMQARKAMLQEQAVFLQARESCYDVVGAAD